MIYVHGIRIRSYLFSTHNWSRHVRALQSTPHRIRIHLNTRQAFALYPSSDYIILTKPMIKYELSSARAHSPAVVKNIIQVDEKSFVLFIFFSLFNSTRKTHNNKGYIKLIYGQTLMRRREERALDYDFINNTWGGFARKLRELNNTHLIVADG